MRRLEAVRLVQWYHFQDETFPIGGSCLLLGDNGSGKTTVLDAIQVALVADLSEVLLNRAANEKSRRTTYGYVRWKLGTEDEERPGETRYGRGGCTSYVMLEFRDDRDPEVVFSCGVGMEAVETDTQLTKVFFVAPGKCVSELAAVVPADGGGAVVRTLREFRSWLRDNGAIPWSEAGVYREELRQRLGVLPESFHRLIVKALAFKPIGQVRQFVFDYLLDPHPIDTAALQSNLEHYKRLEGEAKEAEKRIHELEEIAREGERIQTEQRTAESHQFMELRADCDTAREAVQGLEEEQGATSTKLREALARRQDIERELQGLARELERIVSLLEGHEAFRQLRDLERQLEDAERRLEESETADAEARKLLMGQSEALEDVLSEKARAFRRVRPELFEGEDLLGAEAAPEIVVRLRALLEASGVLAGRDLSTWVRRLERATDRARDVRHVVQSELAQLKAEGANLQEEQRSLDSGRQRYPDGPEALIHLLSARLDGRRRPRPLCELIEVPNVRWRNAVEGYLGARRFDVIVAPEDYPRALALYERHKRDYVLPGRGAVFIANVGLVDIERILAVTPRCRGRSLAEQVETEDAYARAYCDFVLGDVICVDDEQSLRNHHAAITDTVMVYRNHVARQTAREFYSRHFIGEAARRRRLEEIATRLAELSMQVVESADVAGWLDGAIQRLDRARASAHRLPDLVVRAAGIQTLRLQIHRLTEQKARIDRHEIESLQQERTSLDLRRRTLEQEKEGAQRAAIEAESKLEALEEDLGRARGEQIRTGDELQARLATLDEQTRASYEHRYVRERSERTPKEIHDVFERQRRTIESRIQNLVQRFSALKAIYVERHGLVAKVEGPEFTEFERELGTWRESKLPAYREKISQAKAKALEQLAEDVVFRLREHLLRVRRQIEELNRALQDVPFGSEQYQFTVEVEPEHRDFYNLVMDAGRFEKESLFGAAAVAAPELKATLSGLLDRLVEAEAKQVKTELEERADYREYFRYDLKILHADGRFSLYDKVAGDKSGGETQTPYYIAILASMYRVYRSRSADGRPTCGVVLLDEAFGKMDEGRIAATLTFAHRLGLQLILATPKERSELVAPRVDRSLFIHKDAIGGAPTVLDFTKELGRDDDLEHAPADAAPWEVARRV